MELSQAIKQRRMVRSFSPEPVPDDLIDTLISYARKAPSAGNTTGWAAITLTDQRSMSLLWDAVTDAEWRAMSDRWRGLSKAPAAIIMLTDPANYTGRYSMPDKYASGLGNPPHGGGEGAWDVPYWFVDAGYASMLIMLGACEAGVGTLFLGNFRGERQLKEAFDIPDSWRYVGTILLGYDDGNGYPSPSVKKKRKNLVFNGHWQQEGSA
jgi:nitroreductase